MSEVVHKAGGLPPRPVSGFAGVAAGIAVGTTLIVSGNALAAEAQASADEELTEITVTGSRISQAVGMTTPTPVTAISVEELLAVSPTSVTQALTQLPQFAFSATAENFGGASNGFFASPGGGSLNLRGVGAKRTLTLLDSRRVVPATAYGGPDINMFPEQMLQRIEAVTGGASAAFGTDAVSGVVNYILNTKFEGFRASAQTGFTDRRDGNNSKYSIAFGNALGDRSHLLFSAGYERQAEIIGYEGRDWYQACGLMLNPNVPAAVTNTATYVAGNGGYSPDTPRLIPLCNLHSTQLTYDGYFTTGSGATLRRYELQRNGSVIPFVRNLATGSAATAAVQPGGGGQDLNRNDSTVLPFSSRKNAFGYIDYDINDQVNIYAQGMYGEQTLRSFGRVGDFNSTLNQGLTIYRDNAFLPADVARIMDAAGLTSIAMTRAGSSSDWGRGSFANISKTRAVTLGLKSTLATGGFLDGWALDSYVQLGKNDLDAAQEGGIRLDRFYLATDAVIDPVTRATRCRVTVVSGLVPDCVPLNIFGRGNAGPAAVDWIKGFDPGVSVTTNPFIGFDANGQPMYGDPYTYVGDENKHRLVALEQKVFEVSANGKVASGWAGDITLALGAHWRKESVDQKVQASQGNTAADPTFRPVWCPDNVVTTNAQCVSQVNRGTRPPGNIGVQGVPANPYQNSVETQFSNVPFIAGSFTVKELFMETLVPLLSDQPWMRDLNFQGSLRWADYAGSGSIWSWKGGLDASFTDEIRLRGTYSRDTRAANIAERFDRTGGLTLGITDKISPVPTGWTQGTAVTTVNGGNPDVLPEQASTFTVGLVYRPRWLTGFDMSVDWLHVSLKDAIEQLLAQRVVDLCYDESDQSQCSRITRDPTTNRILFIPQTFQNLSKANVEAVDVEMGYSHGIHVFGGSERLSLRILGSYTIENSVTSAVGVKTERASDLSLQNMKKKVNATLAYSNGPFKWNLQARYLGGGNLNATFNTYRPAINAVIYDVQDNEVGASVWWDTRLGYEIPLNDGALELYANVNNLLDRDPPRVLAETPAIQVGGGYDQLGRRYVLGFNLKF
jgi:iron complex outermembrane receptor protein